MILRKILIIVVTATPFFANAMSLIQNYETGRLLDSNYDGHVYTLPQNGGNYQKWYLNCDQQNLCVIRNIQTGRVVDSNTNGNAYTLPENGGDFQKWYRIFSGIQDRYYFQNKATGRYLDSNYNGDVYTLSYNGGHFQKWSIYETN
ncbi:RICIN domain-containing protein [Silvanigrella aquatica]|nr:RICIN domain-containing protein [Silvanigrella aquatica]